MAWIIVLSFKISMVVQVGDQLGDKHIQVFARAMAKKLSETEWTDSDDCEKLMQCFLSLNSNVLGLMLPEMGKIRDVVSSTRKWPLPLQHVCSLPDPFPFIVFKLKP